MIDLAQMLSQLRSNEEQRKAASQSGGNPWTKMGRNLLATAPGMVMNWFDPTGITGNTLGKYAENRIRGQWEPQEKFDWNSMTAQAVGQGVPAGVDAIKKALTSGAAPTPLELDPLGAKSPGQLSVAGGYPQVPMQELSIPQGTFSIAGNPYQPKRPGYSLLRG